MQAPETRSALVPIFGALYRFARLLPFRARVYCACKFAGAARRMNVAGRVRICIGSNKLDLDLGDVWQSQMLLRCYEREIEWLINCVLPKDGVYVDVGAQLGYTAAMAVTKLGSSGRLVLYEPDPRLSSRIRANLAATPQPGRLSIFDVACSDENRPGVVLRLMDTVGWSLIDNAADAAGTIPEGSVSVPTVRLSDHLEEIGIRTVNLLKIDVEGHEAFLLKGFTSHLQRKQVQVVYMEKNPWLLQSNGFSCVHLHALIAKHGYLGCYSDGEPICPEALQERPIENLLYFAEEGIYRDMFRRPYRRPAISSALVEEAWREATEEAATLLARERIISATRNGQVCKAIEMGEQYLQKSPGDYVLRGHLAHWYDSLGDYANAAQEYREIVRLRPTDVEAQRLLACTEKKLHSETGGLFNPASA